MEWVGEWFLLNVNSAICQLYHGENKLIFNEMMMKSTLYQTNTLSWIVYGASSLKQQSVDRLIEFNTGDRSRSRNLRLPRVRFQSFSDEACPSQRTIEILPSVWLFFLHRHLPNFFFLFLCGEILLGCVLFVNKHVIFL